MKRNEILEALPLRKQMLADLKAKQKASGLLFKEIEDLEAKLEVLSDVRAVETSKGAVPIKVMAANSEDFEVVAADDLGGRYAFCQAWDGEKIYRLTGYKGLDVSESQEVADGVKGRSKAIKVAAEWVATGKIA